MRSGVLLSHCGGETLQNKMCGSDTECRDADTGLVWPNISVKVGSCTGFDDAKLKPADEWCETSENNDFPSVFVTPCP